MKFGKGFRTHLDETLPEWRDKFLSYKPLKKLIKNLQPDGDEGADGNPWFGLEEWFVRILDEEIEKFNDFYVDKEEEFVIRSQEVGLSGRSRKSNESMPKQVVGPPSKMSSKRPPTQKDDDVLLSKKRKVDDDVRSPSSSKLLKIPIPEDVLSHSCTGFLSTETLISQIGDVLREWKKEFVKIKFFYDEYQHQCEALLEENKSLEVDLAACRTELSNAYTSLSVHCQEVEKTRCELIKSRAEVTDLTRSLRNAEAKILALEAEKGRLQAEISNSTKGEAALKIIEVYKDSYNFKSFVQDEVEKERNHIYNVEVKALERQCVEDGFIRGFLKGTRLVQRRTGANIEGLTWSQVSEDPSPDLEDDAESVMPSASSGSDDEVVSF